MITNFNRIQDFRNQIGTIREHRGLSQSQLSKYSGLDIQYIQEIESGSEEPEFIVLITLANALEIEVKGLFDY